MTDQAGESAAPQGMETKDLPHGYAPAAVPYPDSTHLGRAAAERDQEVGSRQGSTPTGSTETGGDQKTTTGSRKSSGSK